MILADATKPPAVIPIILAAIDIHIAPAVAPLAESGVTPLAINVLPMSGIGLLVGESLIGFVDGGERIRVSGFENADLVLLFQLRVAHVATEIEEDDFRFLAFALGHGIDDILVGVLPTSGGV